MTPTKLLIGQLLLVFAIMVLGVWGRRNALLLVEGDAFDLDPRRSSR